MTANEGNLLGAHTLVVEQLVEHFGQLGSKGEPSRNVIVLEAPSGYGKTRIIREFYDRIRRADSGEDNYWPALVQEGDEQSTGGRNTDPLPQRKVLGPDPDSFVWKSEALPEFGWWTFNCESMATGDTVGLDSEATDQLNAHSLALTIARNNQWSGAKRYGGAALASIIGEVKQYAGGELKGAGLQVIQSLVGEVAGLNLWVNVGKGLYGVVSTAVNQRQQLRQEMDVGNGVVKSRLTRAQDLAGVLTELSAARLPAIVVIEDAHLMGKDLREMLESLPAGDPNHPVMIIATVWPEGADNAEYKSWLDMAMQHHRVTRIEVPQLEKVALAELIRSFYPEKMTARIALELAGSFDSPYIAKLWLTTTNIRNEIQESADEDDLADYLREQTKNAPNIYDNFKDRWEQLPVEVRDALILAVSTIPRNDKENARFVPPIVDQASRQIGKNAASGLGRSVKSGWSRAEGSLYIIRELLMTQVAQEHADHAFTRSERSEFMNGVSAAAALWLLAVRSSDSPHEQASQVLAAKLVLETPERPPGEVALARIVLAEALLRSDDAAGALEILAPSRSQIDREPTEHDDELLALYVQAANVVDPQSAVNAAIQRESWASQHSAPADQVLRLSVQATWSRAVMARDDSAQWPSVIGSYKSLLREIVAEVGENNEIYIVAVHDYIRVLLAIGERVEAVAEYRKLLVVMDIVLGAGHTATLDTKFEFVQSMGRSGKATEMIPFVRDLAVELMHRYGRLDHRTIKTRLALAHWLLKTERDRQGLLPEIDDIVSAATEAKGPTHVDTLEARAARSLYLSRVGDVEGGKQESDDLLRTAKLVFGDEAPEVQYFKWLSQTSVSYLNTPLPALQGGAVKVATGVTDLSEDAVAIATSLYPVFGEAVPEASPEAERSTALREFRKGRGNT